MCRLRFSSGWDFSSSRLILCKTSFVFRPTSFFQFSTKQSGSSPDSSGACTIKTSQHRWLKQVQGNKQAIANDEGLKQSLAEELGTKGKNSIENELIAEKRKFLDKHKIKEG
jgi:hypothetical protein